MSGLEVPVDRLYRGQYRWVQASVEEVLFGWL